MHVLDSGKFVIREKDEEHGHGATLQVVSDTFRLEGIVVYQTLQVGEKDLLHAEAVPQRHEADVPEAETIVTREHLIQDGLLALDALQEVLEFELGHLKERSKVLTWVHMRGRQKLMKTERRV